MMNRMAASWLLLAVGPVGCMPACNFSLGSFSLNLPPACPVATGYDTLTRGGGTTFSVFGSTGEGGLRATVLVGERCDGNQAAEATSGENGDFTAQVSVPRNGIQAFGVTSPGREGACCSPITIDNESVPPAPPRDLARGPLTAETGCGFSAGGRGEPLASVWLFADPACTVPVPTCGLDGGTLRVRADGVFIAYHNHSAALQDDLLYVQLMDRAGNLSACTQAPPPAQDGGVADAGASDAG